VQEHGNDHEEIIERIAALDIGKASLVCCSRVPAASGGRRVQEVMMWFPPNRGGLPYAACLVGVAAFS
jgi:transposase